MVGIVPLVALSLFAQSKDPIVLQVNATDAPRNLIHVVEKVPVKAGPLLLRFPKWPPGHHSPSGSLANVIDFHVLANGHDIPWKRDSAEMFDIHVDVPQGVNQIQVVFVDAEQPGRMTNKLGRLKFTGLMFIPKGDVEQMSVQASFTTPAGWQPYDAVPMTQSGDVYQLPVMTVERLLDSPVLMGQYTKAFPITRGVELDVAADEPGDLAASDTTINGLKNLVNEAHGLWGAQHYRQYHWLLTLSNYGGFDGLEHNECSEDGTGADTFKAPGGDEGLVYLLSHEYTHSWNGKYRRPADLYQKDYATAQGGSLLWVYEGMTEYWGDVLAARSGLWSPEHLQLTFAQNAASMGNQSGRTWRSTEDTAAAASILRNSGIWGNARRSQDYYFEGTLVWLGADAIIRKQTNDKKSLDDFCKLYAGGHDTGPMIVPYTYQDLIKLLNQVTPYDWNGYLQHMVYDVHPAPTTEGVEMAGWKLVFTDQPSAPRRGSTRPGRPGGGANHMYDMGISVDADNSISDMYIGSAADNGGLTPGMKILTVGDKPYSDDVLTAAITDAAKDTDPIVMQVSKDGLVSTVRVDYHGGLRYPHLVRIDGSTDYLDEIGSAKTSGN